MCYTQGVQFKPRRFCCSEMNFLPWFMIKTYSQNAAHFKAFDEHCEQYGSRWGSPKRDTQISNFEKESVVFFSNFGEKKS